MSEGTAAPRKRRRDPEWTHRVLIDALLALVAENRRIPTRREIADRAGVSERTVFVHFADREALYETAAQRQAERWRALVEPIPATQPTDAKIDALLEQRARMYELMTPIRKVGLGLEPDYVRLQAVMAQGDEWFRADLTALFTPELDASADPDPTGPGGLLDSLEAASSWAAWDHLRARRGLGPEDARRAVARTLRALLG